MLTKKKDVLYCNVREEVIKKATPLLNQENLKYLYGWISERYNIHLKKDVKKEKPQWTKDPILKKYRFTNVRREHDKESKWLIKNICNNENLNYKNKMLNIILFRLFNKSDTIKIFSLIDFDNLNVNEIKSKLIEFHKKNENYVYFSNAFFTSGPKAVSNKLFPNEKNMVIKIINLVNYYENSNIITKINKTRNQKEVFEALKSLPGIGTFFAYQIFVDFTYMDEFPFSENEFVVAGPGCKKGLKLLFKNFDRMSYEEALFWFRDNQNKLFSKFGYDSDKLFIDLPKEERYLNLMSLENSMCELSKYIRALKGEGRPRVKYK